MTRSNEVHNKNSLQYYSNHELTLRHFKKYSMPWPLRNRSQQLAASSVTFHIVDQATSRTSSHILRSTRSSINRSIFCNRLQFSSPIPLKVDKADYPNTTLSLTSLSQNIRNHWTNCIENYYHTASTKVKRTEKGF